LRAAALALAASLSWGVGDFLGGVKARVLHPLAIMAISQPVGLVLLGIAVAARATGPPGGEVAWALLSAVFGTTALAAFYRGMAVGAISIVAPIAGAGAAIPVVVGVATGDRPSALQGVGFVAAIGGVVLSSWERSPGRSRWAAGAGFGIVAMVGFGLYFVFLHMASTDDFLWPAFLFRCMSVSMVWVALAVVRPAMSGIGSAWLVLVLIGCLDTGGNTLFAAASSYGSVSVTSVLASLYPVVTVLLARYRLHERVHRLQEVGIALTLAGVVLVSAG
jgi:drug/metabolite transporter (DMT)-like permease